MTRIEAGPYVPPCRDPWPQQAGVYCTRPKGHKGGHLDAATNHYWQAEEPASVTA